ncbi:FecR domain-containing protein [Azoarcus sp. PA01]|nr:FecR domain-containing protein [Azoarcus sp. PA01]
MKAATSTGTLLTALSPAAGIFGRLDKMFHVLRLMFALPLVLLVAGSAWADPPGRVGRLALLDGEVSLRPADSRRWESASLNWPLTSGDALSTEGGSRAEIRIGSSVLRLAGSTSIDIRQLDDERIRIELERGSLAIRIRSREAAAAIEVETRDGLVVADEPGQYRVDYEDATTVLTNYRGGELDFRSEDSDVVVSEGRRAHVLFSDHTEVRWSDPERDDFTGWTLARDAHDDRLGEPRYVSPEMTGVEDLHEYGDWRTLDDYGPVWYPRSVPPGWAPYRSGRWVLVQPWGWTWVDDAPWGFAPFHYGRWVMVGGTWAWVPGAYVARPVYAPALVVWMGLPGVSISLSSGSLPHIGWFPLGPREVYVPSYRHSTTYVRRINITHVTNIVHIDRAAREPRHARYAHRDRRDAVTVVPGEVVRHSRPVFRHVVRDDEHKGRLPRAATPVPPLDPRLVVEHDRVERARRPRDEERLRDEQARRSARLREAVEERRQREHAGPEERRLRAMPEDGRGRETSPGRRIDGREQGRPGTDGEPRVERERERERRLPSAAEVLPRDPAPAVPQPAPQQNARELQQRQHEQERPRQQPIRQQRNQEQQQQERAREQAQRQRALEQHEQQRRQTLERQEELRQRQSQQRERQQQEQLQRQQQERMQRQQRDLEPQQQQRMQQELEQQRRQAIERQEALRQRQSQDRERQLRQQQSQQQDQLQRQQRQLERQREMQERRQSEQRSQIERRAAGNEGDASRGERRRAGDEGRPGN